MWGNLRSHGEILTKKVCRFLLNKHLFKGLLIEDITLDRIIVDSNTGSCTVQNVEFRKQSFMSLFPKGVDFDIDVVFAGEIRLEIPWSLSSLFSVASSEILAGCKIHISGIRIRTLKKKPPPLPPPHTPSTINEHILRSSKNGSRNRLDQWEHSSMSSSGTSSGVSEEEEDEIERMFKTDDSDVYDETPTSIITFVRGILLSTELNVTDVVLYLGSNCVIKLEHIRVETDQYKHHRMQINGIHMRASKKAENGEVVEIPRLDGILNTESFFDPSVKTTYPVAKFTVPKTCVNVSTLERIAVVKSVAKLFQISKEAVIMVSSPPNVAAATGESDPPLIPAPSSDDEQTGQTDKTTQGPQCMGPQNTQDNRAVPPTKNDDPHKPPIIITFSETSVFLPDDSRIELKGLHWKGNTRPFRAEEAVMFCGKTQVFAGARMEFIPSVKGFVQATNGTVKGVSVIADSIRCSFREPSVLSGMLGTLLGTRSHQAKALLKTLKTVVASEEPAESVVFRCPDFRITLGDNSARNDKDHADIHVTQFTYESKNLCGTTIQMRTFNAQRNGGTPWIDLHGVRMEPPCEGRASSWNITLSDGTVEMDPERCTVISVISAWKHAVDQATSSTPPSPPPTGRQPKQSTDDHPLKEGSANSDDNSSRINVDAKKIGFRFRSKDLGEWVYNAQGGVHFGYEFSLQPVITLDVRNFRVSKTTKNVSVEKESKSGVVRFSYVHDSYVVYPARSCSYSTDTLDKNGRIHAVIVPKRSMDITVNGFCIEDVEDGSWISTIVNDWTSSDDPEPNTNRDESHVFRLTAQNVHCHTQRGDLRWCMNIEDAHWNSSQSGTVQEIVVLACCLQFRCDTIPPSRGGGGGGGEDRHFGVSCTDPVPVMRLTDSHVFWDTCDVPSVVVHGGTIHGLLTPEVFGGFEQWSGGNSGRAHSSVPSGSGWAYAGGGGQKRDRSNSICSYEENVGAVVVSGDRISAMQEENYEMLGISPPETSFFERFYRRGGGGGGNEEQHGAPPKQCVMTSECDDEWTDISIENDHHHHLDHMDTMVATNMTDCSSEYAMSDVPSTMYQEGSTEEFSLGDELPVLFLLSVRDVDVDLDIQCDKDAPLDKGVNKIVVRAKNMSLEKKTADRSTGISGGFIASVDSIWVDDGVKDSVFSKVLSEQPNNSGGQPLGSSVIHIECKTVCPEDDPEMDEVRLRLRLNPMCIDLDQNTVEFLQLFWSSVPMFSSWENITFKKDCDELLRPEENPRGGANYSTPPTFFQTVQVDSIQARINYKPRHLVSSSEDSVHNNSVTRFLKLLSFRDTSLKIRPVRIHGVESARAIVDTVMSRWMTDISRQQLHSVVSGLPFVRNAANIVQSARGGGSSNATTTHNYHHKNNLRSGMSAFASTVAAETLDVSAQLAVHVSNLLGGVGHALGAEPCSVSAGQLHRNRQPEGIREGMANAVDSFCEGFVSGFRKSLGRGEGRGEGRGVESSTTTVEKRRQRKKENDKNMASRALSAGVTAVIHPTQGVLGAIYQTMAGVRNNLDPVRRTEIRRKYGNE
jgi:hypothetical protein